MASTKKQQTPINHLRLGLIVNPFAGVGGPAGFKGSDCRELVEQAIAQGAQLRAPERAGRCLKRLKSLLEGSVEILTYPDLMGEQSVRLAGLTAELVGELPSDVSSAEDTQRAAKELLEHHIDLLLFVGGDGTARDICEVVVDHVPVLGIPAGVKMQSGVFAVSPEAAAELIAQMVHGELVDLRAQEVRDIDEEAFREGRVQSRYFGELQVPQSGQFVQQTKQGGKEIEELVLDDIAADLIEQLEDGVLYLVGAGTTPKAFMDQLGLENTLLGIDVVCNEQLIQSDVSGPGLEELLAQHSGDVIAILSITGHQGSLIGRGNQQLTPEVLRRIGRDNVRVLATKTKIRELAGRPLLMDSNCPELDLEWQGYISVITGYHDTILYPLGLAVERSSISKT